MTSKIERDWCNHGDWSHRGECAVPRARDAFVLEQFLRDRFAGWRVPDAVVHRGRLAFMYELDDCIAIAQHRISVMRAEHEAWLRVGHDPGDEDRS